MKYSNLYMGTSKNIGRHKHINRPVDRTRLAHFRLPNYILVPSPTSLYYYWDRDK